MFDGSDIGALYLAIRYTSSVTDSERATARVLDLIDNCA